MSAQEFCQVVRKPRHQATGDTSLRVWVERPDGRDRIVAAEAHLVDVSRNGLQVQVNKLFATGEAIVVRIAGAAGLEVSLPGTVQWQRAAEKGAWSVGCSFPEPLAWETIGELFLNQILATDAPAH